MDWIFCFFLRSIDHIVLSALQFVPLNDLCRQCTEHHVVDGLNGFNPLRTLLEAYRTLLYSQVQRPCVSSKKARASHVAQERPISGCQNVFGNHVVVLGHAMRHQRVAGMAVAASCSAAKAHIDPDSSTKRY